MPIQNIENNEAGSSVRAKLNQAIEGVNNAGLEIVEEIPTTLEPQQRVFVTATNSEWIGADPANGLFPTLDAGTPWPVKGYKEVSVAYEQIGTNDPSKRTDVKEVNDGVDYDFLRDSVGRYDFMLLSGEKFSDAAVNIPTIGLEAEDGTKFYAYPSTPLEAGGNDYIRVQTYENLLLSDTVLADQYVGIYTINLKFYPPQV